MKTWKWMGILLLGCFTGERGMSSIVVPDWDGEANTTSVYYSFPTGENPPVATAMANAYGPVQTLILPGTASSGWNDPTNPFHVTRGDGTGAWNINPDGYITSVVPFASSGAGSSIVEVWVDVIGYYGITLMPGIQVSGTASNVVVSEFLEELDPLFPGAEWRHKLWKGMVEVTGANSVTVTLTGAPRWGSHIDRIAIYTQAIPEPAVISLVLAFSGLTLFVKRRLS